MGSNPNLGQLKRVAVVLDLGLDDLVREHQLDGNNNIADLASVTGWQINCYIHQ
jgi:hypothetical protein